MRKGLSSKALVIALGAGFSFSATSSACATALEIHKHRQDSLLACVDLADDRFSLSFIHSASLTPVRDEYQITQDGKRYRITQTAEKFIAHGQGLPSMKGEPDATAFIHENGKFILQLNRPIDRLIVRTDKRYENRLHTGDNAVNLNQWRDTALWIKPVSRCTISHKNN